MSKHPFDGQKIMGKLPQFHVNSKVGIVLSQSGWREFTVTSVGEPNESGDFEVELESISSGDRYTVNCNQLKDGGVLTFKVTEREVAAAKRAASLTAPAGI